MEECDTLLIVGHVFPYIEFLPKPGKARGVQIDLDPKRIGLRYPVEVGLVGDSRRTLQELLPLLQRKDDRSFLEKAQEGMKDWRELMEAARHAPDKPMKPQVVAWELGKRLRDERHRLVAIPEPSPPGGRGTSRRSAGRCTPAPGTWRRMAPGLPYTIAAQIAYPDRQCVAFVGDGGFSMLMAEFATAVKYKLPIKVVIIKNNTLGQIKWEQMVFLGNPEYGVRSAAHRFRGVRAGLRRQRVSRIDDPADVRRILDQALAVHGPGAHRSGRRSVRAAACRPNITMEQAAKFAESLVRGEPNRTKIMKTVLEDKVKELV